MSGLGFSLFARRYSGNRVCFFFLRVLRCFSSPRLPLPPMYSVTDIRPLRRMGSPIQKSSGQCLFSGSPKLIAANHVFHRHPAPRHPPSALSSLAINLPNPRFRLHPEGVLRCHLSCIQFSKNKTRFRAELKAQSRKPSKTEPSALDLQHQWWWR
jgi:hypothetical protein